MSYKMFCQEIYDLWKSDPKNFSVFEEDFDIYYLPEPYYPLRKGEGNLIVLNNNPGNILPFQHYSQINNKFTNDTTYEEISEWLMGQYISDDSEIGGSANSRNCKIIEIATALGLKGVENVETFFLHSRSFNKLKFLKEHLKHDVVSSYTEALSKYLQEKIVLIVACVGSKRPLTLDVVRSTQWLQFQAKICGLDLNKAEFRPVTTKNGKVTSGVLRDANKIMICCMGSNNIPIKAKEVIAKWGKA